MRNQTVLHLVQGGVIAALYVVLTLTFAPVSFGAIQFRVSELLVILPVFTPAAIPGVFIGCLLGNWLAGAALLDVVLGSLATLIGAYGTYLLRKKGFLSALPPIVSNGLIIPFVLRHAYGAQELYIWMLFTVALGELLAVGVLGNMLRIILEKYKGLVFPKALS